MYVFNGIFPCVDIHGTGHSLPGAIFAGYSGYTSTDIHMNHLVSCGDHQWVLPAHAHLIVHDTADGNEFITIYRNGTAQEPPVAQLIGNLVRIDAPHTLRYQPTGYTATLDHQATLRRQDNTHWVVRDSQD